MRLLPCALIGLGTLLACSAPTLAEDPPDAPAAEKEDPAAERRRKRLELDERKEKLPEASHAAMELVNEFQSRELRVWNTFRGAIIAQGKNAREALLIGLDELDWETRAFAAACLAELHDASAIADIADSYAVEEFVEARRQYALAVAAIGSPLGKELLLTAVKEDDLGIRLAALQGLGRLKDPSLAKTLADFVADDEWDVRYEALGSLAAIGDRSAIDTLVKEAQDIVADKKARRVDSLKQQDNSDRYSHYLLGLALARAGDKDGDKILVKALLASKPYRKKAFLRMGAAAGLGRRAADGGELHPKLVSGISHKDTAVRIACTYGAGFVGAPELVGKLGKALGDSQLDVRQNAVAALGKIGTADAASALRKSLSDKAGEVRTAAVRALGGIHEPEATSALLKALKDPKFVIRVLATRQLAPRAGDEGVLPVLLRAAKDPDFGVREQAMASLSHHPDGKLVMDAVTTGLDDADFGVNTNACLGLARISLTAPVDQDDVAARRVVSLYLGTKQKKLLRGAEEFLDAVRPPASVQPLLTALDADAPETRRRADLALRRMSETSRNFIFDAPKADRDKAAARWREWWKRQEGRLAKRGERIRSAVTGSLAETARDLKWKGLDIALLFDSTGSMAGLIRAAKARIDEMIAELGGLLPSLRVSVYTYRDFGDNFVFWGTPLTYDTGKLSGFLQNATHGQGGDIPEAVYETCKNAMEELRWRPEAHKVIVYAGDAPHHPEFHGAFITSIREFCTVKNQAVLHAIFTDTNRRSLDIAKRKNRVDPATFVHPFFEQYKITAQAGRGRGVLLDDESALIKELLVLTFGESWRADIENLLDFQQ